MTGLQEGDVYAIWLRDEGRAVIARLFVEDETTLRLQPLSMFRPMFKQVRDIEIKGRVITTIGDRA